MASVGPTGFYAADYFCDYPPGYLLLLWPIGSMITAVGYSASPGVLLLVKTIPILCDMVLAMFLFSYAKKRISIKAAAFLGLFFAFNPAALVTGASWGQVDSLLALLLVVTAITGGGQEVAYRAAGLCSVHPDQAAGIAVRTRRARVDGCRRRV